MKRFVLVGFLVVLLGSLVACNWLQNDAPLIRVMVRAQPGEEAGDMASGNEISFGKPPVGEHVDVEFMIQNLGTLDLILETAAPHYVGLVDQNEAQKPFSILAGVPEKTIKPGEEARFTIRFTGQNESTRYSAKLLIPSNDKDHPDYNLDLIGDGVGFN